MKYKFAALTLFVVAIMVLVSCNQGKIDELTENVSRLEAQNQQLMQENNSIKAYIDQVVKVIKSIDEDMAKITDAEVDLKDMTKNVDMTALEGNIKTKLGEIGDYIVESKTKLTELETSLAESKHDVKSLRSLVNNVKAKLADKESEIQELAANLGVMEGNLADLNNELEQKNTKITEQEDLITKQNTRYYTMAKPGELKEKGIIETKGGFLFFGKTTKLAPHFSTDGFSTLDASKDFELTIPAPASKVQIYTPHMAGSYQLVDAGDQSTLTISDATEFWAASNSLVIGLK